MKLNIEVVIAVNSIQYLTLKARIINKTTFPFGLLSIFYGLFQTKTLIDTRITV